MNFDPEQFFASVLVLLVTASAAAVVVFQRSFRRRAYVVLVGCALVAMTCWFDFGKFHTIYVDVGQPDAHGQYAKVEQHQPFHLHEFFHYYIGAKYFPEVGYLELYDCATLADKEIAEEDGVPPRINVGWVRDLYDVLKDKPYDQALADCRANAHFAPERWASFKNDLRELHRLVPDEWWNSVVGDAGFNPPPSWILVGHSVARAIPIRAGSLPTYLLATGLDMALLLACFLALRRSFGRVAAVVAAVFFGATFIASYGWNGGAFLRFTWITSLVLGLCAMRRGRWALAGGLLAASAFDRVFPAGFAVGAMVPLAWQWWRTRTPQSRRALIRFAVGLGVTGAVLAAVSAVVFGPSSWTVFAGRIDRHGDVYYVAHMGLKKVMTYRDWVPNQNFFGHDGLGRFRSWNLRLREVWHEMWYVVVPVQLLAVGGAFAAALRRRPYEAALVCGIVFMFAFSLPANYYYVVLALVPALLVRAAASAPSLERRMREYAAFVVFCVFWMVTLICSRVWNSDIQYNFAICVGLATFLLAWMAAWGAPPAAWWKAAWGRVTAAAKSRASPASTS